MQLCTRHMMMNEFDKIGEKCIAIGGLIIPRNDNMPKLNDEYKTKNNIVEWLVGVINKLLRNREFLCLQLDHAYGNIDDDNFNSRSGEFIEQIKKEKNNFSGQPNLLSLIFENSNIDFDAETISVMIGCTIEKAEEIMDLILNLNKTLDRQKYNDRYNGKKS